TAATNIRDWVNEGGVIIAIKGALNWISRNNLGALEFRRGEAQDLGRRPYQKQEPDAGSNVIGGAIFEADLDITHPLGYGYRKSRIPVFRNSTIFLEPAQNAYGTPLMYTEAPLLSGYINDRNSKTISNSASIVVSGTGSGRVICMTDNPNFRAFWYGTNKLFANAIFFGHTISSQTIDRPSRR
ncbi:MAG: zinc carboxypeptidase, partial [Bacteroidota bacterium]